MHEAGGTGIDDGYVARIADEADVDKRTVVRRLAGLPVRGRAGRRIDSALVANPPSRAPAEARTTP